MTAAPEPRLRYPRLTLATAALAVALAAADTYVVVLALEEMMQGVGLGIDQLQRATPIVSGFLLGYIAALPLIGRLADLVARQRVLVWCLVLFLLGSVVTALATELPVMIGGRVIQGVGGGGLVPATLALVADVLPRRRRGMGLGVVSAVQEVGSVLGPLLGAGILAAASWRAIFWVNAIAALLLAGMIAALGRGARSDAIDMSGQAGQLNKLARDQRAMVLARLGLLVAALGCLLIGLTLWSPERLTSDITYGLAFVPFDGFTAKLASPLGVWGFGLLLLGCALCTPLWWPRLRQVDALGAVLVTVALGTIVWSFAAADATVEVMSPSGVWLLPLGALCLIGYVVRHRMARTPLVQRGTFSGRVPSSLLASFLAGTALVAVIVEIPVLARLTVTNSQTVAAFVLLRFLIAVPLGAVVGGALLRRCAPALVAAPGFALAAAGIAAMSTWHADALNAWTISTLVLVVSGFGVGLTIAPLNDVTLTDAPADAHGIASALVVLARMMGMVVGLALLTSIGLHRFSSYLQNIATPTRADVTHAGVLQVHTVFIGASLAALLGAVVVLAGWRLTRVDQEQ